jgi:hypothetical protein
MSTIIEYIRERERLQSIINAEVREDAGAYWAARGQRAAIDKGLQTIGKLYLGIEAALARDDNSTYEAVNSQQTATMVQEHFQQQGLTTQFVSFEKDNETAVPYGSVEVSW